MFDLTTLDYIYIGIVLASTVWATIRGGVYETVATVSWIVAALVSRFVSPHLDLLFQKWFGLTESTIGTLITAYFLIFFVILVLFSFFNQKLRDRVQESMLKITDHTLGVIFGIIRGIVFMGLVYWGALWYYSDSTMPDYVAKSRMRPVMQLTTLKIHDWFLPTPNNLLERDITGTKESEEIYNNLINPKVEAAKPSTDDANKTKNIDDTVKTNTSDKIDGAVKSKGIKNSSDPENKSDTETKKDSAPITKDTETGYKNSERTLLENQLLQIENTAKE